MCGEKRILTHFFVTLSCLLVFIPQCALAQYDYLYLKSVSVNDSCVELTIHTMRELKNGYYKIHRSDDWYSWKHIQNIDYLNHEEIKYCDYSTRTDHQSYYYMVVAVDSTNNPVDTSNIGRTIFLDIFPNQFTVSSWLTWNDYDGWFGFPGKYKIWRSVDNINFTLITTIKPMTYSYQDHLINATGDGDFIYFIEAIEGPGNKYGRASSTSNRVTIKMDPRFYVPNTIIIDSTINVSIKPNSVFMPEEAFKFSIYNSNNVMVFETYEINEGWDGRYGNSTAIPGKYLYYLEFVDKRGIKRLHTGTIQIRHQRP